MTLAAGARGVRLRLVVDTGVFVSALISAGGAPRQLLDAAVAGRVTLVISPLLLAELRDVLYRPKFRRWFSEQAAEDLLQAIRLLGELVPDPDREQRQPICRDPDDEYLLALAEVGDVTFLVSGDRDLVDLTYGPVLIRTPQAALAALDYRHPWGETFVPGSEEENRRRAQAEGHDRVLDCAGTFITVLQDANPGRYLAGIVTPESLPNWMASIPAARAAVTGRGMTTRPEYPTPDIAYVKLVPDPGVTIMATAEILLEDALILTMQRRPELPQVIDLGGWRVHALGNYCPIDQMPSP